MRSSIDIDAVRCWVGASEATDAWLAALDAASPGEPFELPGPDQLAAAGVPHKDMEEMVAVWPSPEVAPEAWWILERATTLIVGAMGSLTAAMPPWPALPESTGALGRYLPAFAYLAVTPHLRAWHASRGIDDAVTTATLGTLGIHVGLHRRYHGIGGVDAPWWLTSSYRGFLFRLGRLEFNRSIIGAGFGPRFWLDGQLEPGFRPGDFAIGVHIPEVADPFSESACDDAFDHAAQFFPNHFPEEYVRIAICSSWLMDPQLAEYLPASSNIVAFQRRFELVPGEATGTADVMRFALRRLDAPSLDDLPQRTTLERAIVAHLRAGREWHVRTGWVRLARG